MSQTFEPLVSGVTTFGQLYGKINNMAEALRSAFSGTSFPISPQPVEGQFCYRTDQNKLYVYVNGSWQEVAIAASGLGAEIINARGTKSTLDQRLNVSLNEDGTLKSNVSAYQSQWIKPSLTFTYVNSTTFTVNGDQTDIYTPTRRLKINLEASVAYSSVVSSTYNSGENKTTVTIEDAVLDSSLVDIEHSIISPIKYNGAISKEMLDIVFVSSSEPSPAKKGMIWLDTTNGVIKQYDGTQWVSKVSVANSATNATNATNADKVDNYHASQTPTANTIPVAGSNGLIANGWLANSIRGFENTIDTVAYYNQTGNDYPLAVGEVAKITFSNTQNVPLRIATQSDTEYMMWIIPSNTGGTSGGSNNPIFLYPNNTTYSNEFVRAAVYRNSAELGSSYTTHSSFRIGLAFSHIFCVIRNLQQYKNIIGFNDIYGISTEFPTANIFSADWRNTTTEWTSLGTVVFPQNSSGYILVQRIL